MSITYVDDISEGSGAFIFIKILARWKGSLYKLLWIDLLAYLFLYYVLNFTYRFALSPVHKKTFENIVEFCDEIKDNIPVSFLLGFFVSGVIGRWYQLYQHIPWLNHIAYATMAYINTSDPIRSRDIRLSMMRYMNLSWILLMRQISDQISSRFKQQEVTVNKSTEGYIKGNTQTPNKPTHPSKQFGSEMRGNNQFVSQKDKMSDPLSPLLNRGQSLNIFDWNAAEGAFEGEDEWSIRSTLQNFNKDRKVQETFGKIITEEEIRAFEYIARQHFVRTRQRYLPEFWVPLQWAVRLVQKSGLHGNIFDPRMIGIMLSEIGDIRNKMQNLQIFSSIIIPLVYTQVVIIAVYSYFICMVMASQFVESVKTDFYIPIFSIFYFMFLLGWLKVALCVMNPFGDDDEDFETSVILDYNLDISYRSVLMEEQAFPNNLPPASFDIKPMKGYENDNLSQFLQVVKDEINDANLNQETNDITNLEVLPSHMKRIYNKFCCALYGQKTEDVFVLDTISKPHA